MSQRQRSGAGTDIFVVACTDGKIHLLLPNYTSKRRFLYVQLITSRSHTRGMRLFYFPDFFQVTESVDVAGAFYIISKGGREEKRVEAHEGAIICLRWNFEGFPLVISSSWDVFSLLYQGSVCTGFPDLGCYECKCHNTSSCFYCFSLVSRNKNYDNATAVTHRSCGICSYSSSSIKDYISYRLSYNYVQELRLRLAVKMVLSRFGPAVGCIGLLLLKMVSIWRDPLLMTCLLSTLLSEEFIMSRNIVRSCIEGWIMMLSIEHMILIPRFQ